MHGAVSLARGCLRRSLAFILTLEVRGICHTRRPERFVKVLFAPCCRLCMAGIPSRAGATDTSQVGVWVCLQHLACLQEGVCFNPLE